MKFIKRFIRSHSVPIVVPPAQPPASGPYLTPAAPTPIVTGGTRITPHQPGGARIMITDGGPHPHHAWAQVTAEHVAPIGPNLAGERYVAALKLQLAIVDALLTHHQAVQNGERAKLADSHDHLLTELAPEPHVAPAVAAIQAAASGTEWDAHFQRPEVVQLIGNEIATHYATMQHIERSWHVDRNPSHPHAAAWRARHHPGV